jgi:allantoate deiminase
MVMTGAAILARIEALAAITAGPGVTRIFLTPEQKRATALVLGWMREAGMAAHEDAIGNVVGRYEGTRPGVPALVLGSHLDTVRNAGKFDGILGVVTGIACVQALHDAGERLPCPIEVIGFADEEGVRFPATLLGSHAVAGRFHPEVLDQADDAGVTLAQALVAHGLDPARVGTAGRSPEEFGAYLELHIEQGPVLEARGLPVGCVTSIAGATRMRVELTGVSGHSGTVPMGQRHDALAGAAECVIAIERRCGAEPNLVGTVGRIEALPGAVNVIPGGAVFSIDVRAPEDGQRARAVTDVVAEIEAIAARRELGVTVRRFHDAPAAPCAPRLRAVIRAAIAAEGLEVFELPSGAGHDGMAIAELADIGMIFVRCLGGISHNPAESVTEQDAETGARVLLETMRRYAAGEGA